MTLPTAWTFSSLEKFETCPRQYYHVRVAKDVVEPPTEATLWGERVHTALEHRVRDSVPLPEGMTQWEGLANKLANLPGEKLCEEQMAVDQNFQPAPWKQAWSRGIADLLVVHGSNAVILDHKTGKRKLTDQLALYAGYVFARYSQVKTVTTGFVWLKDKKIDKENFDRDEVPAIWKKFLPKVRKLESAYERDAWPCRPSGLCKGWCPVKQCEFYKDKT
jgi:PD-(D/E)XK nuclease superfamily